MLIHIPRFATETCRELDSLVRESDGRGFSETFGIYRNSTMPVSVGSLIGIALNVASQACGRALTHRETWLYGPWCGEVNATGWHSDTNGDLIALLMVADHERFEGGTLQIRDNGGDLHASIDMWQGDLVVFDDRTMQHNRTAVKGDGLRRTLLNIKLCEVT